MLVGYPHLAEDLWHWCQGHPGPILEAWSWNGGNGKIMAKSRKNRENRRKWRLIAGKTIYFSWEMFQQAKLQVKTQVFSVENIIHIYIYIPLNPIHWRLHPQRSPRLKAGNRIQKTIGLQCRHLSHGGDGFTSATNLWRWGVLHALTVKTRILEKFHLCLICCDI